MVGQSPKYADISEVNERQEKSGAQNDTEPDSVESKCIHNWNDDSNGQITFRKTKGRRFDHACKCSI